MTPRPSFKCPACQRLTDDIEGDIVFCGACGSAFQAPDGVYWWPEDDEDEVTEENHSESYAKEK